MDVQSAAPVTGATTGTTPATGNSDQAAGIVSAGQQQQEQTGGAQPSGGSATLASVVAKLYNPSQQTGEPTETSSPGLSVSYKVIPQLDLIVTVFSNPQTGEEVAQFPPEVLIGLAEFFDHVDGVTIDQKV